MPQFWAAFDDAGLVAGAALKMILLTGQRPGEVAHMRREHIDDGWWEMPGEPVPALGWPGTKNGATHRVWLPKPAQALLAELATATAPASCSPARAAAVTELDKAMRAICAQARRRAGDAARSAADARHDRDRARLRPRRNEPRPEPQGGRHRRSTTGTNTPTRTST